MPYPETTSDLPQHMQTEGVDVVRWDAEELLSIPEVAQHITQAALAAKQHGLELSGTCITRPPSEEDLDERLEGYRQAYEHGEILFESVRTGQESSEEFDPVMSFALHAYLYSNALTVEDLERERASYLANVDLDDEDPVTTTPEETAEEQPSESEDPDNGWPVTSD